MASLSYGYRESESVENIELQAMMEAVLLGV